MATAQKAKRWRLIAVTWAQKRFCRSAPSGYNWGKKNGSNAIDAEVKELIYLGDHIRCRMNVMGNEDFVVKVANSAGHTHLNVGEKTTVSWDVSDCRALDA